MLKYIGVIRPCPQKGIEILFIGRRGLEEKMLRDLASIARGFIESGGAAGNRAAVMGFCMGSGLALPYQWSWASTQP